MTSSAQPHAMDAATLRAGARVMVAYSGAFVFAVLVQVAAKVRVARAFREAKKRGDADKEAKFNRYAVETHDDGMIAGDRAVGNLLEWAPWFITLFWTHLAVAGPDALPWGWAYVGLRFAYPVLAQMGGVTRLGARPLITLSTVPGYLALVRLAWGIVREVGLPLPGFGR